MLRQQRKFILLLSTALLTVTTAFAKLDDLNLYQQVEDTRESMIWPLLPNESLDELAAKFYPNNPVMQRKFIAKTNQLNKDKLEIKSPQKRNAAITSIVIPNLKSLSAAAGSIKRRKQKSINEELRLSYDMESTSENAMDIFKNIPARLMREYEELVIKNTFLKEEIAKLNKRLVFLQAKLGELKLVMDRTLSTPAPKKAIKNLNPQKQTPVKQKPDVVINSTPSTPSTTENQSNAINSFFDLSNYFLWIAILALGLLFILISYLYKKYKDRKYRSLVDSISRQNKARTFSFDDPEDSMESNNFPTTNKKIIEEEDTEEIIKEAKKFVAQNEIADAIEHLKWAIKAKEKIGINVWLLLLKLLRQSQLKDEFETIALQMHQHFNVMTPLWTERAAPMVVPQSLEDFPYIIKFLTDKWPNEKIIHYLEKLISDNRSGERSGFSQPIVEEILLLIVVLKARQYL